MRAWVIRAPGGFDRTELADFTSPAAPLGPRDVRVGIRAAALNHLDLFVVQGLALDYRFPHILGADGAGVVEAVGGDVATLRPGDRLMLNPGIADYSCEYCRAGEHSLCRNYRMLGEHLPGTLTESVVVPEQNVAVIPTLVPPLGWAEAAAFSAVTLTAWRMLVTRALGRGGRLVSCGGTTGPNVGFDLRRLFWYQWSILGSTMGNDAEYREIVRRLGAGELRPLVDRVFPFADARGALERLARGEQWGKIVVQVTT